MSVKPCLPVLQSLAVEQIEAGMGKGDRDRRVVLVQCGNEPVVHPRHRDLACMQRVDHVLSRLAAVVNLERVAVGFVFYDNPRAAIVQRIGQNAELFDAVGFVIDGTDDGQSRVERAQDFGKTNLIEEIDEQVRGGRAAVDHEQIGSLRSREHAVDFAAVLKIDELRLRVEALQRRVFVVAVDRAMSDAAIFEILNEVRGEEAFSDAAFAVDDEVDLFVHKKMR